MNLRNVLASAAAGALAVSSTAAIAQADRSAAPATQESAIGGSESAPWPLLIVGIAALAALIYLLVDDDGDAVSA